LADQDEIVRLVSEIGYAAVHHGLGERALPIFDALAVLRPQSAAAAIGRALVALSSGKADEAARILEQEALAAEPDSRAARSMLGLALRFAGRNHDSRRVLEQLLAEDGGDSSSRLARELLEPR
jgi:thioredoxin-like negative regulator of GroEL